MRTVVAYVVLLIVLAPALFAQQPTGKTGAEIYSAQCVKCHGANGEGDDEEYPDLLVGDKSVLELSSYIDKTMPKGAPKLCVAEDARKVAEYIYHAFYSPTAQARLKPARVALARLTVRQYQNSLADLIGSFRTPGVWKEERGLRGEYFKSRGFRTNEREIDRLDPQVDFDFGEEAPHEKLDAAGFSIRWQGSVIAPETGEYEFIVRSDHAIRLWVNDDKTPLIDAWVKSGDDKEFRATIPLLGGRAVTLNLEFSKAKQGVNDKKELPKRPASISLRWKRPGRMEEVIPQRLLFPGKSPEVYVVATPFPPDDRSEGYERGGAISKSWDQAKNTAAIEAAGYIAARIQPLAGVDPFKPESLPKLKEFCQKFAERAFRRPLNSEQTSLYIERAFAGAPDGLQAVKRSVLLTLLSPRFLYPDPRRGEPNSYDVSARLALALWDSLPDAKLLEAAAKGELKTREQVLAQANRMTEDPRAKAKLRTFFVQWLKADEHPDLSKDSAQFPEFTPELVADLRTSLDLFVEQTVFSQSSDFRQLLLADKVPLNGKLAAFYGAELPADSGYQNVSAAGVRSGVLTHPYLLASFAYTSASSPIHRGVFVTRSLLGRTLRPPPEAAPPLSEKLHPSLTTRERVVLQTKPEGCMVCHSMINPLGFTLENFDAVGRFRDKERGKPIDATGAYISRSGDAAQFAGVKELAQYLVSSEETQGAFVEQMFQFLVKQPIQAYGETLEPDLRQAFRRDEFHIRKLSAEIAAGAAIAQPKP